MCARLPSRSFIVSSVVVYVARRAEVVAVQVQRVRQLQFVDDPGEGRDDLRRRHLACSRAPARASPLASLPHFHAATPPGLTALTP